MAETEHAKLGDLLVAEKVITPEHLRKAVELQQKTGERLGHALVKLGFIGERKLTDFIAKQQGLPTVNLEEVVLARNLISKIPRPLMEKYEIVPLWFHDDILIIATSDPLDLEALEALQLAIDCRVEMNIAPRSAIRRALKEFFGTTEAKPVKQKAEAMSIEAEGEPAPVEVAGKAMGHGTKSTESLIREFDRQRTSAKETTVRLTRPAPSSTLSGDSSLTDGELQEALIPLLIERGIITREELIRKAKALAQKKG